MGIWKHVTDGPYVPTRYARQLERELHIAKQALEALEAMEAIQNFSEDNLAKNTSRNALKEINTLSA